ncbi:MAG TPA: hypothetical protein VID27_15510 [Blastocatellia bacterium]|jgi:hypothetical protein
MTPQELIAEIFKLPSVEQRQVLEALLKRSSESSSPIAQPISEAEFEQRLLAKGIISEIPSGAVDHEEDFDPIEVTGQPLSETILEERR